MLLQGSKGLRPDFRETNEYRFGLPVPDTLSYRVNGFTWTPDSEGQIAVGPKIA